MLGARIRDAVSENAAYSRASSYSKPPEVTAGLLNEAALLSGGFLSCRKLEAGCLGQSR